jgi:hypothetical protein
MTITISAIATVTAIVAFVAGVWVGRRREIRHRRDTEKAKREINEYFRRAEIGNSIATPT